MTSLGPHYHCTLILLRTYCKSQVFEDALLKGEGPDWWLLIAAHTVMCTVSGPDQRQLLGQQCPQTPKALTRPVLLARFMST